MVVRTIDEELQMILRQSRRRTFHLKAPNEMYLDSLHRSESELPSLCDVTRGGEVPSETISKYKDGPIKQQLYWTFASDVFPEAFCITSFG